MANESKTLENLHKKSNKVKEGLEHDAYELGSKVKETLNETQKYAKNGLHSLEDQARDNPLLAIGISFLVGVVASKLFGSDK
ncbi:MAG: hypothetical protein ACK4V2_04500 [Pseudomonadota bacterium]|jgi:ElaB/YqjD/DUF883 family membrane-anchored ribosome-binding protein|nr:hypothetical protein [Alphaproteobacteria bacterium]